MKTPETITPRLFVQASAAAVTAIAAFGSTDDRTKPKIRHLRAAAAQTATVNEPQGSMVPWFSALEGLALLMVHASGMTREDFMADYPKKISGLMETVHGQNVRNCHWEFFREMNDVRNDVGTAFSRKNPFAFRNGFCSAPAPFTKNEWHKLQLVQSDGKIRVPIDGKILLEIDDNSRTNTGCILKYGHIALRCMVHTAMVFRNLKVFTEKLPFTELK